ncbi:MAG: hypothetical protein ABIS30_10105, partial [Gallionella sp.]
RLTAEAVAGVIQVEKTTYNRIRHDFAFEPPATLHVKGKGEMVMYRLTARLSGKNAGQFSASGRYRAVLPSDVPKQSDVPEQNSP